MKRALPLFLLAGAIASGQDFRKFSVNLTGGAGIPRDDLRNALSNSGGIGFTGGYRPIRYLMAEVGYETLFGAARVRDFVPTAFGNLRIRDYQQFLPFGGRVILPMLDDKLHIYGGGGGVYIRYSERLRQPFQDAGFRFECPQCALRDGTGYYAQAGFNVAIDRAQLFRVGGGTKVYNGATSGDPLGAVPSGDTRDRWVIVFGSFSVNF
ncbi:MAG TPA: hypothetical protein VES20_17400 [Bryobacteraceae bacterium]|nr:hypothetical protein [Bryobacteraceae bacterium]